MFRSLTVEVWVEAKDKSMVFTLTHEDNDYTFWAFWKNPQNESKDVKKALNKQEFEALWPVLAQTESPIIWNKISGVFSFIKLA